MTLTLKECALIQTDTRLLEDRSAFKPCFISHFECHIWKRKPVTHACSGGRTNSIIAALTQLISPWLPELIFFLWSPWSLLRLSREIINQPLNINATQRPFSLTDKRQSEITDALTASSTFRNVDENEFAFWVIVGVISGPGETRPDCQETIRMLFALRVMRPDGKGLFGFLRKLPSPLDSLPFYCDGNRKTENLHRLPECGQNSSGGSPCWRLQQKWKQQRLSYSPGLCIQSVWRNKSNWRKLIEPGSSPVLGGGLASFTVQSSAEASRRPPQHRSALFSSDTPTSLWRPLFTAGLWSAALQPLAERSRALERPARY